MATTTRIPRVSFEINKEVQDRIKSLPKSVNISEEMRTCLDKVLNRLSPPRPKPRLEVTGNKPTFSEGDSYKYE